MLIINYLKTIKLNKFVGFNYQKPDLKSKLQNTPKKHLTLLKYTYRYAILFCQINLKFNQKNKKIQQVFLNLQNEKNSEYPKTKRNLNLNGINFDNITILIYETHEQIFPLAKRIFFENSGNR
jgi:hypothetical protein